MRYHIKPAGWFWIFYVVVMALITWLVVPSTADARRRHHERWYQQQWCDERGGRMEVVFPDRTRCDCLTDTNAIEFDFANKWEEAIGQALYYSLQTGKKAGIVLILEQPKDMKYWIRLNSVIEHDKLEIDTWRIGPETIPDNDADDKQLRLF